MFFRAVTSIVSTLTAIILGAIAFQSAMAATHHIQVQAHNNAIIPGITLIASLYIALLFGMPKLRQNLLVRSFRPLGRVFFVLLCVVALCIILLASLIIMNDATPTLYGGLSTRSLPLLGLIFGGLFFLTFLFPGFAFQDLRKLANIQDKAVATYTPTLNKRRASRGASLGSFQSFFGGTPAPQSARSRITRYTYGLLFTAYVLIGVYGWREAHFLPSQAHLDFVSQQQVLLTAAPIAVMAALIMFWQRTPGKGPFRSVIFQKLLTTLGMAVFVTALTVPLLTKGLPDLYSFVTNGPVVRQNVIVIDVQSRKRKTRCDHSVMATLNNDRDTQVLICAVPDEIWERLGAGDLLTLSGPQTPYGIHFTNIERATQQ